MPRKKKSPKKPEPKHSAEWLKHKIDEEREELDRLDNHAGAPVATYNCNMRIELLQKELKEDHGIDY
jgi:hypothetical protein